MKIEANTLQEAFQKAAQQLNCSVTELDIKVLQHPSGGIFGFFKKTAIIEANLENQPKPQQKPKNDRNFAKKSIKMRKMRLSLSKKSIKMTSKI